MRFVSYKFDLLLMFVGIWLLNYDVCRKCWRLSLIGFVEASLGSTSSNVDIWRKRTFQNKYMVLVYTGLPVQLYEGKWKLNFCILMFHIGRGKKGLLLNSKTHNWSLGWSEFAFFGISSSNRQRKLCFVKETCVY